MLSNPENEVKSCLKTVQLKRRAKGLDLSRKLKRNEGKADSHIATATEQAVLINPAGLLPSKYYMKN